jgi:hypothetical protein
VCIDLKKLVDEDRTALLLGELERFNAPSD